MLPTNCVISCGVVTKIIYGRVIAVNVLNGLAPSIRADSYKSSGIFIRIPDIERIVYGIPTQIFTIITVILAISVELFRN